MKRIIITAMILAASLSMPAMAQELNQTEAIKEQMSSAEASQLEEAEDIAQKAEQQLDQINTKMEQATKLRKQAESLKKGKAKKLIKQAEGIETPLYAQKIAAYNKLEKANGTIYGLYAADLKNLAKDASEKKQVTARSITNDATNAWDKGLETLKKVPTSKSADPKAITKLKEEANRYQNEAIGLQIQQYAMLLGWFDKPETQPADEAPLVAATEETKQPDRIIFKVQIAASFVPLSLSVLREIYKSGEEKINNELENNVYKYSVGYYPTYEEAEAAKKRMGVKGAFVVGYKNGVKVSDVNELINNQ
ncbi:MAG: hypothetical protein MJZ61_01210 [Bacteroidales bacterium]|nr:hypothetical protein [Bacteroidales bacterium]